jgi:hypothetical protein
MAEQRTEGEGREPEHTHPAVTHSHDHWHVSHHVNEAGEVEHRVYWHTHSHNHAGLTHTTTARRTRSSTMQGRPIFTTTPPPPESGNERTHIAAHNVLKGRSGDGQGKRPSLRDGV